jgi:hypothetical protein
VIANNLDDITAAVLQRLIDNRVSERRTLEYKSTLPGTTDDDKREFLADVSSFANANGGDLIYGISEERSNGKPTGLPGAIAPIDATVLSTEMPRLENLLRDCVNPRIHGIEFRQVPLQDGKSALVLRIPRSWIGPHMVTFKPGSRFYSRNATGKHIMDVSELRTAFALSSSLPEKLRGYRIDRTTQITSHDSPIAVPGDAKIILHLLPLAALEGILTQDFTTAAKKLQLTAKLMPIDANNCSGDFNFDGYVTHSTPVRGYVQLFRSGTIEVVDGNLLNMQGFASSLGKFLPGTMFEEKIIAVCRQCLDVQKTVGVPLPIFFMMSLNGVKDYTLGSIENPKISQIGRIDRQVLLVPPLTIEHFEIDVPDFLYRAFNSIWQASGADGSPNYDSSGKRLRR